MGAYFQMGNDMENLVGEIDLTRYHGIVLSPVNRAPAELMSDVPNFRRKGTFDIVLDPQLYVPTSQRGFLRDHTYFPTDLDTADPNSGTWWADLNRTISNYASELAVDSVTSPFVFPKVWNDEFYLRMTETASSLASILRPSNISTLQTVMVNYEVASN
jgi:hypothetical protein